MNAHKRIFLIGHPGAGKALVAKSLAEKLGWKFIDADLGLESRIGATTQDILGQGENDFHQCQYEILMEICKKDNIVVTTDASIVCSEKSCELLSKEFTVYLKVSTPVQMERTSHQAEFLLSNSDRKHFFEKLHHERDSLYQKVSTIQVDSDNSALDDHVSIIMKSISEDGLKKKVTELDARDLTFFHRILHTPVQLGNQQALCFKYLAQGLSAKEIAREMNLSFRTVEGTLAKVMELLGCSSSKELIMLYHAKH